MMKEPISKKEDRELVLSSFSETLNTISNEGERDNLKQGFVKVLDAIYLSDKDFSYDAYKKRQIRRTTFQIILGVIIGVFVVLIPFVYYINTLGGVVLPYKFIPDALGYPKPIYYMKIKTTNQVQEIKNSGIMDAKKAKIGGGVDFGSAGLFVVQANEASSPEYHMKEVGPQNSQRVDFGGTSFIPDTVVTFDPLKMNLIKTEAQLESIKRADWVKHKENVSIGAAVRCPIDDRQCFILDKSTLKKEYIKIVPIDTYRPVAEKDVKRLEGLLKPA